MRKLITRARRTANAATTNSAVPKHLLTLRTIRKLGIECLVRVSDTGIHCMELCHTPMFLAAVPSKRRDIVSHDELNGRRRPGSCSDRFSRWQSYVGKVCSS